MAVKISELPTATSATTADVVPIVQGGVTKQLAIGDLPTVELGLNPTFNTVTVDDDAYDVDTWNSDLKVPTKNALRDKFTDTPEGWINVKDYGAVGDGVVDDIIAIRAALEAASIQDASATTAIGNRVLYFPPGNYRVSASIELKGTFGLIVQGAGRFTTTITGDTNIWVFYSEGCAYCGFRDFKIATSGTGVCFDLSSDGTFGNDQGNTFDNVYFQSGAYGLRIGAAAHQGSENQIRHCHFDSQTSAGLYINGSNALANTVLGGNFQNCEYGIRVDSGCCGVIQGVGFQGSGPADIRLGNGANDTTIISGCRTESESFIECHFHRCVVISCNQLNSTTGAFFWSTSGLPGTLIGCTSESGDVTFASHGSSVIDCDFGRDDWYSAGSDFYMRGVRSGTTLLGTGSGTALLNPAGYVGNQSQSNGLTEHTMFASVLTTPVALSNSSTSAQSLFASANNVLTLRNDYNYFFELQVFINTGTTTHTTALGFAVSQALLSIRYWAELWSTTAGTISTTAPSVLDVATNSATVLNATSVAPHTVIRARGLIRTGGSSPTLNPQITFNAGPTGTCEVAADSYIKIWPADRTGFAAWGPWA